MPREHKPQRSHQPRRLQAIILLPTMATLGNLVSGFFAIFCCILAVRGELAAHSDLYDSFAGTWPKLLGRCHSFVNMGAFLIILAMVFDALDGRLARITRRTSEFGAQLDSICDILSFGVAPAMLLVTVMIQTGIEAKPLTFDAFHWQATMLAAVVYICCAAMRLARYNVENVHDETGQKTFSGLPVPGAAGGMVALLVAHETMAAAGAPWADWTDVLRWVMTISMFFLGLLMLSRVSFTHVFNVYVRKRQPLTHLIWFAVICWLAWYNLAAMLVALACIYILGGIVCWIFAKKPKPEPITTANDDKKQPPAAKRE